MSFLKKLFGGGGETAQPERQYEDYKGFRIAADPVPVDGQFRIGAWIEKEVDGELKSHRLVRADILRDRDEAVAASVAKAKVMIDQMGEGVLATPGPAA